MSSPYAVVNKSDSLIINVTRLTDVQASKWPQDAAENLVLISESEYTTAREGLRHPGSPHPAFSWSGTKFIPTIDERPIVTFTPSEIKAELGEAITIEMAHSTAGTGPREFVLGGAPIRLDFVAGKASVEIDTDNPGFFSVDNMENFRVTVPLRVTVFARKLGRKL